MINPHALWELKDNIQREITNSSKTSALSCVGKYFQKVQGMLTSRKPVTGECFMKHGKLYHREKNRL